MLIFNYSFIIPLPFPLIQPLIAPFRLGTPYMKQFSAPPKLTQTTKQIHAGVAEGGENVLAVIRRGSRRILVRICACKMPFFGQRKCKLGTRQSGEQCGRRGEGDARRHLASGGRLGGGCKQNCRCAAINFYLIIISKISLMSFNAQDFASPYVTVDEVLEIKKAFDLFDRDLGGAIDPRELKVAINSLGIEAKAQAVYQMIAELDKDGSGQIEFPEFFYMMTTRPSDNETRDEVHKVFITYDSQKTGFIALKDLRKVAKDLGELTDDTILQEMIERADTDGDGVVSEEEFYNLITKKSH